MAKNISIRFNRTSTTTDNSRSPSPMAIILDESSAPPSPQPRECMRSYSPMVDSNGVFMAEDGEASCSEVWNDASSHDSDHVIDNVIEQLNRSHLEDEEEEVRQEEIQAAAAVVAAIINTSKPLRPTAIQLNGNDYNQPQEEILTVIYDNPDELLVTTAHNNDQSDSKKKKGTTTVGSKMDKIVRQFQGSFAPSTAISQTKSESSSPTTVKRIVKPLELGDAFMDSGPSLSNSVSNLAKVSTSTAPASSNWFNDMKLFHNSFMRNIDKNKTTMDEKKGHKHSGADNNLGEQACETSTGGSLASANNQQHDQPVCTTNHKPGQQQRARSPTPSKGVTDDIATSKRDKESKKTKLSIISATSNKKDSGKHGGGLKSKPNKTSSSPNVTTSLAGLLSIITTSNKQAPIAAVPEVTPSTFSPIDSLPPDTTDMKLQKSTKIPVSKSMVSFRKTKNGNEEVSFEESIQSVLQAPANASTNPTLRRRTIGDINFKLGTDGFELPRHQVDSYSTSSASDVSEARQDSCQDSNSFTESESHQLRYSMLRELRRSKYWDIKCIVWAFLVVVAMVAMVMSMVSPLPQFLNGFLLGFVITFLIVVAIIFYITTNYILIKSESSDDNVRRPATPDSVSLRRSRLRRMIFSPSNNNLAAIDSGALVGWVSEFIGEYELREKEGFRSRLALMVLQGTVIHLLTPKEEMSEKKLKQFMSDCKWSNHISYSSLRTIDFSKLSFKRVTLFLTKNVRNQRKYIWSKKFPICIEFSDDRVEYNNSGGYMVQFSPSHPSDDYIANRRDSSATSTPVPSPTTAKLVMFARTAREKEEWFWAIKNAIDATTPNSRISLPMDDVPRSVSSPDLQQEAGEGGGGSSDSQSRMYLNILTRRLDYQSFLKTNVLNVDGSGMMTQLTWLNVLLNRLSFDILNKPNWSAYIAKKLQLKLKKLRLPYFMDTLVITEIDIGNALPKFNSVPSAPMVDEAGLWIDFDVSYSGGFTMTLETRVNVRKIKGLDNAELETPSTAKGPSMSAPIARETSTESSLKRTWLGYRCRSQTVTESNSHLSEVCVDSDSDLDSIVTSSEDEEPESAPADPDDADTDFKQRKFTRVVDRIAGNQYFQRMSQTNFIRKMLENFSKLSLVLTVQVNSLNGTLAINIPESPSDRLWYGFRNDPQIQISARPKLGDHDVNVNYLTNLIEKKLKSEFFNYFVIPNMDDLFIPALNASIEPHVSVVP